jgi:NAD dependent epimerase/dehydratase family enzyme
VFGIVQGGVFQILRRLAKFCLGGRMGSGRQFVSWIHDDDFCRAIEWVLEHSELSGPINVAAPNPVTNAEMMRMFRHVCGIPLGLPASEWMLEVGAFFLRTETELLLKSRRVVPSKLLANGFQFHFPKMEDALRDLDGRLREKVARLTSVMI